GREVAHDVVHAGRKLPRRDGPIPGRGIGALAGRDRNCRHQGRMMRAADDAAIRFDDGAAYECFMGRWSRAAGVLFLDWLAPPTQARWLEIGCGSGAFTALIHERCHPAAIVAL